MGYVAVVSEGYLEVFLYHLEPQQGPADGYAEHLEAGFPPEVGVHHEGLLPGVHGFVRNVPDLVQAFLVERVIIDSFIG